MTPLTLKGASNGRRVMAAIAALTAAGLANAGLPPASAETSPPAAGASQAAETNRTIDEKALEQRLSADEPISHGHLEIGHGHVDIGPKFVNGRWTLMIHDDHEVTPTWRSPDDVVFRVHDTAKLPVPDDAAYDFVAAHPGQEVYVVPQTEMPGVVWPGWNTQDPEVQRRLGTGATLTFEGVRGPGEFSVHLENGNFSGPQVLWNSQQDSPQDIWVPKNSHTHANWIFTKPGPYLVQVKASATLSDGQEVSETRLLKFAVGDATASDGLADARPPLSDHIDTASGTESHGLHTPSPATVVVGLAMVLTVTLAAVVARRRRRAQSASRKESGRTLTPEQCDSDSFLIGGGGR